MFILRCKDVGVPNCVYEAKHLTEDRVISLMMEHLMKTHPKKVKTLMLSMTQLDIVIMMRKKIKKEIISAEV